MKQVSVKDERIILPSYGVPDAEEMPMFAENRVHQRSSGNPYPNKVVVQTDREHRTEKAYRIITLENEYLRIELMPELGGRIYSALDKRTGYDFFYRQHVIKPALIGLLGSWISGGCEFNWPCHHRPSTFMPVDVAITKDDDGSVTVWMSEHEPFDRMKGMVGVFLAPGAAVFETRMRVVNRTPVRHSFLWWENAAVPVNPDYRLVFPPDVHYVQFHYRKNVTEYPVASGVYNGIRMGEGVDISYHKNTRQPTSYFCAKTKYDFFGGYDEGRRCGVVHVADKSVSVGKKMFTWAYNQLSRSWENALTDSDGAYAELMASSYSANQPDFTWLQPYETKRFRQSWYPIGAIGAPLCACYDAAVSAGEGKIRLQATRDLSGAKLIVNGREFILASFTPDACEEIDFPDAIETMRLVNPNGKTLLSYEKTEKPLQEMPETLADNPALDTLTTAQDCYLAGVHAAQYRDPAVLPDAYWKEALCRDGHYAPALLALSRFEYEHLRYETAYEYANHAFRVLTRRNFHPESGECTYLLGLISEALGNDAEASEWYLQSAWMQDTRSRALTRAAMLEGRRRDYEAMLACAQEALAQHAGNAMAAVLEALAQIRLGREKDAARVLDALLSSDPLDQLARAVRAEMTGEWAAYYESLKSDARQTAADVASDLAQCGERKLAAKVLKGLRDRSSMSEYLRYLYSGDQEALAEAPKLQTGIAYPARAAEYAALQKAVADQPNDVQAVNLLACQLYASGNPSRAADLWQDAVRLAPDFYMPYRNLAVAYYSHLNRREEAARLLDIALEKKPGDQQLIWEKSYLMTRLNRDPNETVQFLKDRCGKDAREDIAIEYARALNLSGRYGEALASLLSRRFTPCEGGEHAVAEQYMFAHHALGRSLYALNRYEEALEHFRAAQALPDSLGAGLWNEVLLVPHQYYEALCLEALGQTEKAAALLDHILLLKTDYFSSMHLPELDCWQALVLKHTNRHPRAQEMLSAHMRRFREALRSRDPGYFKTTPFFISYMENAQALREASCLWQMAMAQWAAGDPGEAAELARRSLSKEPSNLYATLLI